MGFLTKHVLVKSQSQICSPLDHLEIFTVGSQHIYSRFDHWDRQNNIYNLFALTSPKSRPRRVNSNFRQKFAQSSPWADYVEPATAETEKSPKCCAIIILDANQFSKLISIIKYSLLD